jgi:hypothetical protein
VFDRASSMYVNNIKDQLDAKITILLISKNQLNMFSGKFCPSSGAQDCGLQQVV